jgi:hypothetical protein
MKPTRSTVVVACAAGLAFLQTSTASADSFRISSEVITLTFAVETTLPDSTLLDNAHIDIQAPYQQGGFFGSVYQTIGETPVGTPDDSYLFVNPTNRLNLSAGELGGFDFIGATPNEDFWLLPQALRGSSTPDYLYLGLAADAIEPGALSEMVAWNPEDPRVSSTPQRWTELQLRDVRSPDNAEFALFQLAGSSSTVFYDTIDGIGGEDSVYVNANSHGHYNWSFTQPGVYEIDIQAFTVADLDRLPGDATLDGTVDLADFTALRNGFGTFTSWAGGDFDGDGIVSLNDFTLLRNNFGVSSASDLATLDAWYATVVPEPTLAGTGVFLALGLLARRRA